MSAAPVDLVLLGAAADLTEEEIARRIEGFVAELSESCQRDPAEPESSS